jgi:hypothetical protein
VGGRSHPHSYCYKSVHRGIILASLFLHSCSFSSDTAYHLGVDSIADFGSGVRRDGVHCVVGSIPEPQEPDDRRQTTDDRGIAFHLIVRIVKAIGLIVSSVFVTPWRDFRLRRDYGATSRRDESEFGGREWRRTEDV